jgi:tetratricopeptide (TPR) repeat protein
VLEGSVQKEGERLRITVQLVDALNGRHLWAERFDRSTSDVFAVQDEITLRVSTEMQVKLTEGDRARMASQDTRNIDSWLLTTEGFGEFFNFTREGMIRARELWESAQAADPNHATPVGGIGLTHWYEARRGWSASREESLRLATKFAERAIEMGPTNPIGYQALGNILILRNEPERAIEIRRKAIKLAPNDFSTVAGLASQLMYLGQEQEAVELFEHSLRLSPKPPWWVPANYGIALHLVGRKQESVDSLKEAIGLSPKNTGLRAQLAAVYTDLGHMDKAMIEAAEVLRINSNFTISSYKKSRRFQDPRRIAWLKDLMIRAGLPE